MRLIGGFRCSPMFPCRAESQCPAVVSTIDLTVFFTHHNPAWIACDGFESRPLRHNPKGSGGMFPRCSPHSSQLGNP